MNDERWMDYGILLTRAAEPAIDSESTSVTIQKNLSNNSEDSSDSVTSHHNTDSHSDDVFLPLAETLLADLDHVNVDYKSTSAAASSDASSVDRLRNSVDSESVDSATNRWTPNRRLFGHNCIWIFC